MDILFTLANIVELTTYIFEKKYEAIPKHKEETAKLLYEQGNSYDKIASLTGLDKYDILWVLHKEELFEFEEEVFKETVSLECEARKFAVIQDEWRQWNLKNV